MDVIWPDNPLRTRADLARALHDLVARSALGSAVDGAGSDRWDAPPARHAPRVVTLEATARPLWGLAAHAAGGGRHPAWDRVREQVARGVAGGWGEPADEDQRIVEAAGLGFALALAPHELWDPLPATDRRRLADWLGRAAARRTVDNNWHLFPVVTNLGLARVGAPHDPARTRAALDRIEHFHRGRGWYSDGPPGKPVDYYGPFALHHYGLLWATLSGDDDPARADRLRARAADFATEFRHWFAPDGAALPFGRSLGYRFAQGAFWGALAFAGVPALPWGEVRGLLLRHLRWWNAQPVPDRTGPLPLGYRYPAAGVVEQYLSAASPFWATKAFLPLALADDHPLWTTPETPGDWLRAPRAQAEAGFLLVPDGAGGVTALAAARADLWGRGGEARYGKFAYSTRFGFGLPTRTRDLEGAGHDGALAVSDDGVHWRLRDQPDHVRVTPDQVVLTWRPWPDVRITTRLLPRGPWHLRLHEVDTARPLWLAEGGFAVPRDDTAEPAATTATEEPVSASATADGLVSAVRGLLGWRAAELVLPDPGAHLMWPRPVVPTLRADLPAGRHRLAAAVLGTSAEPGAGDQLGTPPGLPEEWSR